MNLPYYVNRKHALTIKSICFFIKSYSRLFAVDNELNLDFHNYPTLKINFLILIFNRPGSKWRRTELTYRISKYPKKFKKSIVDKEIARAFELWSDVTPLNFVHKKDGRVHIDIRFVTGEHGDGDPFDGPGTVKVMIFAKKCFIINLINFILFYWLQAQPLLTLTFLNMVAMLISTMKSIGLSTLMSVSFIFELSLELYFQLGLNLFCQVRICFKSLHTNSDILSVWATVPFENRLWLHFINVTNPISSCTKMTFSEFSHCMENLRLQMRSLPHRCRRLPEDRSIDIRLLKNQPCVHRTTMSLEERKLN